MGKHLRYVVVAISLLLVGCHGPLPSQNLGPKPADWSAAMQVVMKEYGESSRTQFAPYFAKAGVSFPPSALALLVFKDRKLLQIWAKSTPTSPWRYIRSFKVLAASGQPGPKLQEGDRQVPEGIYHIVALNPRSHYDLSMQLNYPNDFDKAEATADGRTHVGGNIFIHGKKLSVGCIALGDHHIEALFPLVYWVGTKNVVVIVAPNDLRKAPPVMVSKEPVWVPKLYQSISVALNDFIPKSRTENLHLLPPPTFVAENKKPRVLPPRDAKSKTVLARNSAAPPPATKAHAVSTAASTRKQGNSNSVKLAQNTQKNPTIHQPALK